MKLLLAVLVIHFINNVVSIPSVFLKQKIEKIRKNHLENVQSNLTGEYPQIKLFTQILDHSDPNNTETWQQRYFLSDKCFNQTDRTVIFLLINGESEASLSWMTYGYWGVDLTSQFGAIFIQLEHRFYGNSRPKANLTLENLRYLSSEQALADVAHFIAKVELNIKFEHEPQWIVFGGSYSGSLSAWSKMKYPHSIKGAVASSAPLKATLEFPQFFENVAVDLKNVSGECYNIVGRTTKEVEMLLQNHSGRVYLNKAFRLCDPLEDINGNPNTTEYDIMSFFLSLAVNFAVIAQYNGALGPDTLEWICEILTTNDDEPEIERLAKFNEQMLELTGEECLDYRYSNMINTLKDTTYRESSSRQWMFQTCNEFGFYQVSSNGTAKIFGHHFSVDLDIKMCVDSFGENFGADNIKSAIAKTNNKYGGLNYDVENVVFLYGTVDPWHSLGLVESQTNRSTVMLINGTSHCADMYSPSYGDAEGLTNARLKISQLIKSWLN